MISHVRECCFSLPVVELYFLEATAKSHQEPRKKARNKNSKIQMAFRKSGQYSYNFNARENDLCSVVNNPLDILEDLEAYLSEFGL